LLALGFAEDEARNGVLFLMVLFENIHVFNSRSETRSVFKHSLLNNPVLIIGTLASQSIHIIAMYIPGLNTVLGIQPISFQQWLSYLGLALSVLLVMEVHKWLRNKFLLSV
jgi:magnesium-transporting ATPase (P-type)